MLSYRIPYKCIGTLCWSLHSGMSKLWMQAYSEQLQIWLVGPAQQLHINGRLQRK
jgi:hypothetical protein